MKRDVLQVLAVAVALVILCGAAVMSSLVHDVQTTPRGPRIVRLESATDAPLPTHTSSAVSQRSAPVGSTVVHPTEAATRIASPTEPQLAPLRLPAQPIFSDFLAYTWPNHSTLTTEVRVTTERPSSLPQLTLPPTEGVDEEFPCARARVGKSAGTVRLYVPWPKLTYMTPPVLRGCPVKCELTNKNTDIPSVDGYVVDTNGALVNEKYNWTRNALRKRLVAFNTENIEGRRAVLRQGYGIRYLAKPWRDDWWGSFDVVLSYHSHALAYAGFYHWSLCREDIVGPARRQLAKPNSGVHEPEVGSLDAKERGAQVLFFARNCDFVTHRRQGFVRQLLQHVRVDAVGKCLNNKEQTSVHRCAGVKGNRRLCIIGAYPFHLAIENSISLDYVTEKLYEPLLVGTVPIYLGAPNVENFLPAAHSAIIATHFPSINALAHYVKCVLRTPRLYRHYTSWRSRPKLPGFSWLQRQHAPLCQACVLLHANRSGELTDATAAKRLPRATDGIYPEAVDSQRPFPECLPQS